MIMSHEKMFYSAGVDFSDSMELLPVFSQIRKPPDDLELF
jgi:hypothetical protein